jgi:hypothetical protein
MRTKTLLLTAAISAAGLASSMAQAVYSVNAVGYVNTAVPAGGTSGKFKMIANPFVTADNRLEALLPSPAPGTIIYKFVGGNFQLTTFDEIDLAWIPANVVLDFGGGAFIRNPAGAAGYNITWVGEVAEGAPVSNPVGAGFSIKSSKIPQAGGITSALGFNATPGDILYKFDVPSQNFQLYTFDEIDLAWLPSEPSIDVGESFFVFEQNGAGATWNRNFDVTP